MLLKITHFDEVLNNTILWEIISMFECFRKPNVISAFHFSLTSSILIICIQSPLARDDSINLSVLSTCTGFYTFTANAWFLCSLEYPLLFSTLVYYQLFAFPLVNDGCSLLARQYLVISPYESPKL